MKRDLRRRTVGRGAAPGEERNRRLPEEGRPVRAFALRPAGVHCLRWVGREQQERGRTWRIDMQLH